MNDRSTTGLIHHPYRAPAGFEAPQAGVFKASTVIFPNAAAMRARDWRQKDGYTYGLLGTPTTFVLEERIAHLEGGLHAQLVPSGLAAIALVDLALLGQGDEVLIPDNVYGPSKHLVRHQLSRLGIGHRLYDPMQADALPSMFGPSTRLLWVEAPGSVTMEFPDLASLASAARAAGVRVALDNTWGAGLAFQAFDFDVDVSVQALTKYASGGGDVLMGAIVTRDPDLHLQIKAVHVDIGMGVAANDAEAVLRGLPSIRLRYEAQDRVGRGLARWLQTRPQIARVLHPALQGSPGHEHWARHCQGAAGLFSVVFRPEFDAAAVDHFVDALKLFRIGYSWAGPVSLVVPYDLASMRSQPPFDGVLVRFSIGLEDEGDLRADLEQALAALPAA